MKFNRCFFLFIFSFLFFPINLLASINTYTRTNENPLVPKNIIVNDSNIQEILQTPAVSPLEKIYDYADLYTEEEEEKLYKKVANFINASDIDVAIVTTNTTNNYLVSDYAYHFYDYNNFKTNGVVFVICVASGSPEIFMGNVGDENGKVFTLYTDNRIRDILEYIYPDIKRNKYYSATNTYIEILDGFFNLDRDGDYRVSDNGKVVKIIPWIEILVLSVALSFIFIMFFVYRLRRYRKFSYQGLLSKKIDNSTLNVKLEKDQLSNSVINEKK